VSAEGRLREGGAFGGGRKRWQEVVIRLHCSIRRERWCQRGEGGAVRRAISSSIIALLVIAVSVSVLARPPTAPQRDRPQDLVVMTGGASITCANPATRPEAGRFLADPIVFHDMAARQGHLHTFLGNKLTNVKADPGQAEYSDMLLNETWCQVPGDTAAYWIPTMLGNGGPMKVRDAIAYYRCWKYPATLTLQCTGNTAYPADLRMVAGDSTIQGGGSRVTWGCGAPSTRPGPYSDPIEAACHLATAPDPKQIQLTVHVDFPTCFTGGGPNNGMNAHKIVGNTADFHGGTGNTTVDRVAYAQRKSSGAVVCPAGTDYKMPALRLTVSWDYRGDGRDLNLASDGAVRFSMHADFWNTWQQSSLNSMVSRCINQTTTGHHTTEPVPCG